MWFQRRLVYPILELIITCTSLNSAVHPCCIGWQKYPRSTLAMARKLRHACKEQRVILESAIHNKDWTSQYNVIRYLVSIAVDKPKTTNWAAIIKDDLTTQLTLNCQHLIRNQSISTQNSQSYVELVVPWTVPRDCESIHKTADILKLEGILKNRDRYIAPHL